MKTLTPVKITTLVIGAGVSVWAGITAGLMAGIISAVVWLAAVVVPTVAKYSSKVTLYFAVGACCKHGCLF